MLCCCSILFLRQTACGFISGAVSLISLNLEIKPLTSENMIFTVVFIQHFSFSFHATCLVDPLCFLCHFITLTPTVPEQILSFLLRFLHFLLSVDLSYLLRQCLMKTFLNSFSSRSLFMFLSTSSIILVSGMSPCLTFQACNIFQHPCHSLLPVAAY